VYVLVFCTQVSLKTAQSNTLSEHQRTPCFCHLILSLQMILSAQLLSEVGEIFSAVTYDGPSFYGWKWCSILKLFRILRIFGLFDK